MAVAIFVGMLVASRTTSVTTEIEVVLILERWAEGNRDGVGSKGGFVAMDWREVLCKNSWVRRWLWRSTYYNGSALVTRLATKSLNSPRRPQNTWRLKSSREIGWATAANSSNNDFAYCMYIVIEASPCWRSWKDPWSCIMSAPTIYHKVQYIHGKRGE